MGEESFRGYCHHVGSSFSYFLSNGSIKIGQSDNIELIRSYPVEVVAKFHSIADSFECNAGSRKCFVGAATSGSGGGVGRMSGVHKGWGTIYVDFFCSSKTFFSTH